MTPHKRDECVHVEIEGRKSPVTATGAIMRVGTIKPSVLRRRRSSDWRRTVVELPWVSLILFVISGFTLGCGVGSTWHKFWSEWKVVKR